MELGKSIRTIRKEKKVSQKDLATKVGISVTALVQIENGGSMPKKATLAKIADELHVSVPYILFRTIDELDIPESQRELFKTMSPLLKNMFNAKN